ncbi:unnamed protein product [Rangifer tarandus platyrhynchus]|uniref:Uncharacterized protein n=1 Tax=Rangifer tarandus platyrhynchus TaxID=3082113 RepID=A0ACB1MJY4_RANTA
MDGERACFFQAGVQPPQGVMRNSRSERGKISSNTEENWNGHCICGSKSKLKAQGCPQITCSETDCDRNGRRCGGRKASRDLGTFLQIVCLWCELVVAWKMHVLRCFEGQGLAGMT